MDNGLSIRDEDMFRPNKLTIYEGKQVTPLGNLYIEKVSDTLHRVKKFKVNYIGGTSQEISYKTYVGLSKALGQPNPPKFIQFSETGDLVATNQIASIKTYDALIDTRREDM